MDRFLKEQAAHSSAKAPHTRVGLNLMFNFALRQDAVGRNPMTGTARLSRQKPAPKVLTVDQVALVRRALREWRSGPSLSAPRPDGQVRDLIEVMLGTGERGAPLFIGGCGAPAASGRLMAAVHRYRVQAIVAGGGCVRTSRLVASGRGDASML